MTNDEKYDTPSERVERGAGRLTAHFDGDESWKGKIDLDSLSLMSPTNCILAQTFSGNSGFVGGYNVGLEVLGLEGDDEVYRHGFCPPDDEPNGVITDAWKEYLS